MLPQVPRMRVEARVTHGLVARLSGFQVRGQRDLGVHDDVLAAGQAHHHVRPLSALVGGDSHLLVEVAPGAHPGQFHHAA